MEDKNLERIAIALERIAQLMENSERREINQSKSSLKEAKAAMQHSANMRKLDIKKTILESKSKK
jgi:hypothetical protein